jgi:hypothetical protein
MLLIKTNIQKENLAKFLYDIAKIIFAITVITPLAKPETFYPLRFMSGILTTVLFFLAAYILDGKEIMP